MLSESKHRQIWESAFGDFRRADPKNAPKPFIVVHKAAKAYFDFLATMLGKAQREEMYLLHALYGLSQEIKKAGFTPEEVAPMGRRSRWRCRSFKSYAALGMIPGMPPMPTHWSCSASS